MTTETRARRTVRSFVLRQGRMTSAQQSAYGRLWDTYGLVCQHQRLDLEAAFGRTAPKVVEIGFGMGDSLIAQALAEPMTDFIGIEVHKPGVGRLMNEAHKAGLKNVRVLCEDAVEVLSDGMAPQALDGVQIYFPDPWHKSRHHKRRLIQPALVDLLAHRVRIGGFCHLATDWAPYADWMLEIFAGSSAWENRSADGGFVPRPARRPITKFEQRGERLGHAVFDLMYTRRASDQHL